MTPKEIIEYAGEEVLEDEIADLHNEIAQLRADKHKPIDMILPCPRCGLLHVDTPEPGTDWDNPPHKSHKCHNQYCVDDDGNRTIWRPADIPTNGVAAITTRGEADTWPK